MRPSRLQDIGYAFAVYPLTLLNVSIAAMRRARADPRSGRPAAEAMDFEALQRAVGFPTEEWMAFFKDCDGGMLAIMAQVKHG